MKRFIRLGCLLSALFVPLAAFAQTPPTGNPQAASFGGAVSIAVTTSSAATALPAALGTYPVVLIINSGAADAFVAFGPTNAVVASVTTSMPVISGHAIAIPVAAANLYIAAIGSATTTLKVQQFTGAPAYH